MLSSIFSVTHFAIAWIGALSFGASIYAKALSDPRDKKAEKRAYTQKLRKYIDAMDRSYSNGALDKQTGSEQASAISKKLAGPKAKSFLGAHEAFKKAFNSSDVKVMRAAYVSLQNVVFESFKVVRIPSQTPDIELGAKMYKVHCASCHGVQGAGDGPLAKNPSFPKLKPPSNLKAIVQTGKRSPFSFYNHLLIAGHGGLNSSLFDRMSNHELWSVSFFLLSDRLSGNSSVSAPPMLEDFSQKLTLSTLSTLDNDRMKILIKRQFKVSEDLQVENILHGLRNRPVTQLRFLRKSSR